MHLIVFLRPLAFRLIPFEELFDIENDPFEQVNLAKNTNYKEIKDGLIEELYNWMNEQGDFLVKENYMPLLKPVNNYLDRTSKFKKVPKELENTLNEQDYLNNPDKFTPLVDKTYVLDNKTGWIYTLYQNDEIDVDNDYHISDIESDDWWADLTKEDKMKLDRLYK